MLVTRLLLIDQMSSKPDSAVVDQRYSPRISLASLLLLRRTGSRLLFLARSFSVPVELVQKSDVMVTDRPFIPSVQQTTNVTGHKANTSATGHLEVKKATQPVEAPGTLTATWPVEAPSAFAEVQLTGQDASPVAAADRPEIQPLGPASSLYVSGRPEVPLPRLLLL